MSSLDLVPRVLFRDALMIVLDKPAGIAVHRGPKGGDDLERYFEQLRFGLPRSPALAHRLDRVPSGCLCLGRHRKALATLGRLFKTGRVAKTYWAVTTGTPAEPNGVIDLPLGRRDPSRGWWMAVDPNGAPSRTLWRLMGQGEGLAWLELHPVTGRTHQLRVHCAAMGWPILGDSIYGGDNGLAPSPPLHLLARSIEVPLYPKRDAIRVDAPVPEHMRDALRTLGLIDRSAD